MYTFLARTYYKFTIGYLVLKHLLPLEDTIFHLDTITNMHIQGTYWPQLKLPTFTHWQLTACLIDTRPNLLKSSSVYIWLLHGMYWSGVPTSTMRHCQLFPLVVNPSSMSTRCPIIPFSIYNDVGVQRTEPGGVFIASITGPSVYDSNPY